MNTDIDRKIITMLHEQNRKLRLLALCGWGVAGALLLPAAYAFGILVQAFRSAS